MSPGLRDPLGLDGSQPPEDRDAFHRAWRHQLRRIQPGLAAIIDAFDHLRHEKRESQQPGPPEGDPSSSRGTEKPG